MCTAPNPIYRYTVSFIVLLNVDSDTETSTYSADSSLALVHTAITIATVSSPPPSSNPYHSPRKEVIDMLATNAVSIPVVVSACDPMTSTKTALGLASPPTPTPNYALTNRVGKKRSLSGSASADTVTQGMNDGYILIYT